MVPGTLERLRLDRAGLVLAGTPPQKGLRLKTAPVDADALTGAVRCPQGGGASCVNDIGLPCCADS